MNFAKGFSDCFKSYRHDVSEQARQYLSGLMQAGDRKNMERMTDVVPDSNQQSLQQFISNSRWDSEKVIDQVAQEANRRLGDDQDAGLIIDETGFIKKGDRSVGVARQYIGRLGKVDNGQIGVFGVLNRGTRSTPVDVRLYLPEEWLQETDRCERAGIPKERRILKTKPQLAQEIVEKARERKLRFGWVGGDCGYGSNPELLYALDDQGETFLFDVQKDQRFYLQDPAPQVPNRRGSGRGRAPSKAKTDEVPVRVDKWVEQADPKDWRRLYVRDTTKGRLEVEVLHRLVWIWDETQPKGRHWHLIVRRNPETKQDLKYSLSNANKETPVKRLAWMQGQRYWVERSFEDGKSESGMADYQVLGWVAWHHHMALVMMAMLFMLIERIRDQKTHPLLSCADIEALLAHFLPRRDTSVEAVLQQMTARHKRRQDAIESAYRVQRREARKAKSKVTK